MYRYPFDGVLITRVNMEKKIHVHKQYVKKMGFNTPCHGLNGGKGLGTPLGRENSKFNELLH